MYNGYIGVIGLGNVGYPLYEILKYNYNGKVFGYDLYEQSDSWNDILCTNIIFLCVPTNEGKDGRLDMENIDSVLSKLNKDKYDGIIAIKSTLRLGYIYGIIKQYDLRIVVFPEWLREISALEDTVSPEMIVIGGDYEWCKEVLDVCCWYGNKKYNIVKPEEAVLIKLAANMLASIKITFANQIGAIAKEYGVDSDTVLNVIKTDPRCSQRYLKPGKPYGGNCLPKDIKELSNATKNNKFIKSIIEFNNEMIKNDKE